MTLGELVAGLDSIDQGLSIYAEGPPEALNAASQCALVLEKLDGSRTPEAEGMTYLLEVGLAQEAIGVASDWRSRTLTDEERLRALLHYAACEAYLPPDA